MNERQWSRYCTLERIASAENLFRAAARARRGKRRRPDVEDWWLRREREILRLREELLAGTWRPQPYRFFEIHHPKRRVIAAAPFEDRVVHHALCNLLAPVLQRRFIPRSFSCQIGKGTIAARECCRQLTNRFRYVLKCDVRKFFPNIDHAILRAKLEEWVACPGASQLIRALLSSYVTEEPGARTSCPLWSPEGVGGGTWRPSPAQAGIQSGQDVRAPSTATPLFPGDDWVEATARPRGLPIGNLTSQLWGNFYLDALDHWITETQRHGAYLRYTDDFLLFGDDKARLWELRAGIAEQLAAARLKLAVPKSRLLATGEGVPFCGFRFLPRLRPRILGTTKRRFERRRTTLFARRDLQRLSVSVFAWYQFSREGNSTGLRQAYVRWALAARLRRRRRAVAGNGCPCGSVHESHGLLLASPPLRCIAWPSRPGQGQMRDDRLN